MTQEQAELQIQEAFRLLEVGSWEQADQMGGALIEAGYEAGFRVRSSVQEYQENWNQAEGILKRGLREFPGHWALHMQMGTLLAQKGEFEPALKAYEKAMAHPEVEKHWVEMNMAVAMAQVGQVDEALNLLQQIVHPELRNAAFEMQLQILDALQRYDLVLELASEELENLEIPQDDEAAAIMSRICTYIASAYYYEEDSEEGTMFYLRQAFDYDRNNDIALMILRELKGEFATQGTLYGILVQVDYEEGEVRGSLMTTYGVLADSVEEAVEMIKFFEGDNIIADSLKVMETEESLPEEEEELKGIYLVGEIIEVNQN